jgi:hypothetical protein
MAKYLYSLTQEELEEKLKNNPELTALDIDKNAILVGNKYWSYQEFTK